VCGEIPKRSENSGKNIKADKIIFNESVNSLKREVVSIFRFFFSLSLHFSSS